ncbi:diguanylate cyclase [Luteimonas sp. A649]
MCRLIRTTLLLLAFAGMPAFANDALEAEVRDIERLAVTAHWRQSDVRIEGLAPRLDDFSPEQRQRLEFVRLRNLAVSTREQESLEGFVELLHEDLSAQLRVRVYTTAISVAANIEDWPLAFAWLGEALTYLADAPSESGRLMGVASYLHTLVGETAKARELALRGLELVESQGDARAVCLAVSDVALAEDHARNYRESETWRLRQIEECTRAGDMIFIANAKYGVGKMLAAQGKHSEALGWGRQAIAEFEAAGFAAGAWSAKLVVAESLTTLGRGHGEAQVLLTQALAHYREKGAQFAIAETEQLLGDLAERRGDLREALAHRKFAATALEAAEAITRERQLAYLQVEFDTRLKEQQIALLEAEKELAALQVTATQRRQWLLGLGMFALLVTAVLLAILLRHSFLERGRYRRQSERDGLTGLFNYQQIRRRGEAAFVRARNNRRPFTAIVADIDLFKQVNDSYGHAAGDEALRSLGDWISEVVEGRGIAGRSGGDEFTILLEGSAAEAEALLDRLRARLEPITVFGQTFGFDLSAGLCQDDGDSATLEQLLHKADQALYRAKHDGRDRVA